MAQLHEILAVESDVEKRYKETTSEVLAQFAISQNFISYYKTLELFSDEEKIDTPDEYVAMATTVPKQLDLIIEKASEYFDIVLQKEATNQVAITDLVVDGVTIAKDLPATFLLGMETRLLNIREIISKIPVLPAKEDWKEDDKSGEGIYIGVNPVKKYKTKKTFTHKILYEATKEHPAQIEKWEDTKNIGMYTETLRAGLLPQAEKTAMLNRIDKLIKAIKKARQKANSTEIVEKTVAEELFDYILNK